MYGLEKLASLVYLCGLFPLSRETMCAWVEGMET